MENELYQNYTFRLGDALKELDYSAISQMGSEIRTAWEKGNRVYLCGNGGSAANAMHMANDFLYGIAPEGGVGLRVISLTSNTSILTCLANDIDYASIFSKQVSVHGEAGDILIVLSGSGNSENIVQAIKAAHAKKMRTIGILGFSGGKCLPLVEIPIHIKIDDMQIAEDLQLVVGHMVMRWLRDHPVKRHE